MRSLEGLGWLLLQVERASVDRAGAIHVDLPGDPEPAGIVMGERGRICWATSKHHVPRLSDLVAIESGRSRQELEGIYQISKTTGQPLCELLVEKDVLDQRHLRRLLGRHTASALAALVSLMLDQEATFSEFVPTRGRSYEPIFSFSATELLVESIALIPECSVEVGMIPATYRELAGTVSAAMCLFETGFEGVPAIPVSASGAEQMPLDGVLSIYLAAKGLVRPPTFDAAKIRPFANLMLVDRQGWVVAYLEPFLCLFQVNEQVQYARVLSSLLREVELEPRE